jgi:hypothetical protein
VTLFRLADNLAIRVGRSGLWIWAPDVSECAIFLDKGVLREMGLHLCEHLPEPKVSSQPGATNPIRIA